MPTSPLQLLPHSIAKNFLLLVRENAKSQASPELVTSDLLHIVTHIFGDEARVICFYSRDGDNDDDRIMVE